MPMTDWSTIVIRSARSSPHLPPLSFRTTFSASNFGFKIGLLFKAPKSNQNRSKSSENRPQDLPKQLQNSILFSNTRKLKKMQLSCTKTSFLTFTGLQKSSQNRCQNAFKIGFVLDTLLEARKIRFFISKRRQDGSLKFPICCFFLKIV